MDDSITVDIPVDILDDLDVKRLIHRHGMAGFGSLIVLWCWAAKHCPDHFLWDCYRGAAAFTSEDLEIFAQWGGEPGTFVDTLEQFGILGRDCGGEVFTMERAPWWKGGFSHE